MPIPGYPSFTACHADQLKKGKSKEEADKICGALEAEAMGGSNLAEYVIDANGDLFLKYYFADNSTTVNESAVGKFSVGDQALEAADNEAVGLPFSILPRKDLSIKGDWHSWSPKPNATWEDHVAFAKQYAPGHIVAMTKDSNLVSASMNDIKAHNGRLAVVKITDKRARDAYVANPSLIPRQVSPGFMNLETPNLEGINKVKWAHLAAVPKGAYGEKATLYASCIGGNECVNHLVAASVKELDETLSKTYCPVGASETISSLGNFSTDSQIMSDNANTVATTPSVVAPVSPTPPKEIPKGAPITTGTQTRGIVRLKDKNAAVVTPQGNSNQPTNNPEQVDDLGKLKEEVAKMREIQQQNERREQIKRLIPKELFINKGKFDEKAFEAEVEKRLQQGWSDEQLNEFYASRSEILKLTNAGYALPQQQQEQALQMPSAPTGGSTYQTPSDVPAEPTGGSANDYVTKSITELLRYTIRR